MAERAIDRPKPAIHVIARPRALQPLHLVWLHSNPSTSTAGSHRPTTHRTYITKQKFQKTIDLRIADAANYQVGALISQPPRRHAQNVKRIVSLTRAMLTKTPLTKQNKCFCCGLSLLETLRVGIESICLRVFLHPLSFGFSLRVTYTIANPMKQNEKTLEVRVQSKKITGCPGLQVPAGHEDEETANSRSDKHKEK